MTLVASCLVVTYVVVVVMAKAMATVTTKVTTKVKTTATSLHLKQEAWYIATRRV